MHVPKFRTHSPTKRGPENPQQSSAYLCLHKRIETLEFYIDVLKKCLHWAQRISRDITTLQCWIPRPVVISPGRQNVQNVRQNFRTKYALAGPVSRQNIE